MRINILLLLLLFCVCFCSTSVLARDGLPTTTTTGAFGDSVSADISSLQERPSSSFSSASKSTSTVSEILLKGTKSRAVTSGTAATTAITISGSDNNNHTELIVSVDASTRTETTTTAPPSPTNTQPCNLYLEFCTRSYGEITFAGTHNSPFVRPNNAAANQRLDVVAQLNDGIRMLQGQTHKVNETLFYCHTSCDLLNAGTVEDYLTTVVKWLKNHPYEVVTILIGNGDFVPIEEFVSPVENSGLAELAYVPDNSTIAYWQWPTLSELILTGKRAIIFVDYKADGKKVPYLLDEFSYMWETPFSQTDQTFPCIIERPPDHTGWERKMYMANHNLNVEFAIYGTPALVPNTVAINQTNGVEGFGSLGLQANNCHAMWGRYPNFLLVDFYNAGAGSVFEVAAKANNVTYLGGCCGKVKSLAPSTFATTPMVLMAEALLFLVYFVFG